jgi:hypothetical protein
MREKSTEEREREGGREGWGGWKEGRGRVGLVHLGLSCFYLYLFLDSIKPVWFGPVQSV